MEEVDNLQKKYERTRFLNNLASKRFRLKKRTEKESVNVSRVVLQSVNRVLRQREETLIKLKQLLHQACMNGESIEEANKKLREEIQKEANMDISNQRLIRESVKLRTVPIITIAECEGLDAIFKRPMKKGPGIMSHVKDDALLELMELMEKSKNSKSPIQAPKSSTEAPPKSNHVPFIATPLIPIPGKKTPVSGQTKTKTFLSKRDPKEDLSKNEHYMKTLLSQVNFSVEIIPIHRNVPRRILPLFPSTPDVSITLVDAKPNTSMLIPSTVSTPIISSNITKPIPVFNEKSSLLGGKRKATIEIFPQKEEKKWICSGNSTLPNLTITQIKSEPSGIESLFPISREYPPHPSAAQIVDVSKDNAILWNVNVAESKLQDGIKVEPADSDQVTTFIAPKLEKEDHIWS